jgi:CubicO group peptidase (beta-lactamase class C family)
MTKRPWETLVRTYPAEEVTTINREAEEEPRAAGLTPRDVNAMWQSVVSLYRTGLNPAISICVRRRGRVVLDRAIGHARGNSPGDAKSAPKVLATPDTLFNLFSSSKSITAMVIHLLDQRNLLHLDDAVVEYIPEFGKHNKHWITIRHVLTHRAGIPNIPEEYVNLDLLSTPGKIMEILCESEPVWGAGRRLGYHALTGGFVLGEIVRRVTGRGIDEVLRDEILAPLGIENLNYGAPAHKFPDIAVNAFTGPPTLPPANYVVKRALGASMQEAVEFSNDPRFLSAPIPAGNIVGSANEACRFYELLRNEGELDGVRIFEPRTVRRAVSEQTYLEADLTLLLPIRYGLGFMLGGKHFSLYGPNARCAYGHLGFTNVVTWADPERELSVALMTSGKPLISGRALFWLNVIHQIATHTPRTGRIQNRYVTA